MQELRHSNTSLVSKTDVDNLKGQLSQEKTALKHLIQNSRNQQNFRDKRKRLIQDVCDKDENAAKVLKSVNRDHPGRPRIVEDQPGVLTAILDVLEASSATDDRRRSEIIRSVTTLDDLVEKLHSLGFKISRTATYYCLMPR